jgi:hypothetical protein
MTQLRLSGGMIALAAAVLGAAPLAAQVSPRLGFFGGAMAIRVRDAANNRVQTLTSNVPSAEVTLSAGRLLLEGNYAQGGLTPQGTATPRDFVEGKVLAGVRVIPPLALKAGPHARSYVLPGGTRRRLFWELRAGLETPVAGEVAAAKLELWAAVAGRSNINERMDHARGGEAALIIHVPRSPVWGKLAYRLERAQFDAASRSETLECLSFTLGIGLPNR